MKTHFEVIQETIAYLNAIYIKQDDISWEQSIISATNFIKNMGYEIYNSEGKVNVIYWSSFNVYYRDAKNNFNNCS